MLRCLVGSEMCIRDRDGAAIYSADSVNGGDLDIESFHLGYDASNLYVRVDMTNPDQIEALNESRDADLAIYFMQPNAQNFNEVQTNFRTYFGNQILGFPAKKMVAFDFEQLRDDGQAKWNLFDARGQVGDNEQWALTGSSILGGCAGKEIYEFVIPWSDLGSWKEICKIYDKLKTKYQKKKNIFYRPWGRYTNLYKGKNFLIKELYVKPKGVLSLQKHFHRSEHWVVTQGTPKITLNKKIFFLKTNETIFIPVKSIHRIENPYKKPVKIIEAQLGSILKETDIVRYQDIYGSCLLYTSPSPRDS